MRRNRETGNFHATQKAMVTLSRGLPIIFLSNKLSVEEFTEDIHNFVATEKFYDRMDSDITIVDIKFLESPVIELK